jgi:hypothetical protein
VLIAEEERVGEKRKCTLWALITVALSGVYLYPLTLLMRGWAMQIRAYGAYGQKIPLSAYVFGIVFIGGPLISRVLTAAHIFNRSKHSKLLLTMLFCLDVLFIAAIDEPSNPLPLPYYMGTICVLLAYYIFIYKKLIRPSFVTRAH